MITRSGAKRQKVAETSLFPRMYLPLPVVGLVLDYLEIASLVQIAGCNSAWKKEIYENRPELWTVIELVSMPPIVGSIEQFLMNYRRSTWLDFWEIQPASRMTDRQLRSLLRNCKAVERCQILRLTGCIQIRGQGLDPLRGSCVLREIDLRLRSSANPDNSYREVDPTVVLPILSTMPPVMASRVPTAMATSSAPSGALGLSLVKFNQTNRLATNLYQRYLDVIGDWLSEFHEALRRQAEEHNTACGYCQRRIMDVAVELGNESWQMGAAYCQFCRKYTCGGDGDCPCTRDCEDCAVQCCQLFGPATQGKCCPNTNKMIYSCQNCSRFQCEDCFEGFVCANQECCKEYCTTNGCFEEMSRACEICLDEFDYFCPECFEAHDCPTEAASRHVGP